jgi:excisionase family DNA binding protein
LLVTENISLQPDEWLPVKEVAERTGVSTTRIYYLINRRKIVAEFTPAGKDARVQVVRVRDVTDYVINKS